MFYPKRKLGESKEEFYKRSAKFFYTKVSVEHVLPKSSPAGCVKHGRYKDEACRVYPGRYLSNWHDEFATDKLPELPNDFLDLDLIIGFAGSTACEWVKSRPWGVPGK